MKVKIMGDENPFYLEKMINNFIKDKKIIDIKYSPFTLFRGTNERMEHNVYDRVMIIYEEEPLIQRLG